MEENNPESSAAPEVNQPKTQLNEQPAPQPVMPEMQTAAPKPQPEPPVPTTADMPFMQSSVAQPENSTQPAIEDTVQPEVDSFPDPANLNIAQSSFGQAPSKKPLIIALAVVAVIVALLSVGVVAMLNLTKPNTNQPSSPETPAVPELSEEDQIAAVQDVISAVSTALQEAAPGVAITETADTSDVIYQPAGAKVPVVMERTFGLLAEDIIDSTSEERAALLKDTTVATLVDLGFEEYSKNSTLTDVAYYNPLTNVICNRITAEIPFALSCSYATWISEDEIAFANELADAYNEVTGAYPDVITVHISDVVTNLDGKSQSVIMPGDPEVFFNREDSASVWKVGEPSDEPEEESEVTEVPDIVQVDDQLSQ